MHLNSGNVGVISLHPVVRRVVHSFFQSTLQSTFAIYIESAGQWGLGWRAWSEACTAEGEQNTCMRAMMKERGAPGGRCSHRELQK